MSPSGIVGEAYLLIVSIVVLAGFSTVYYSSYSSIGEAVRLEAMDVRDRVEKRMVIAAVYYDSASGVLEVYLKSVGLRGILTAELKSSSFYLFSQGFFQQFSYSELGGQGSWSLEIVADSLGNDVLERGDTVKAVIRPSGALDAATYTVRMVMPTGHVLEEVFSIGG
ncbi:MAG: hypothetical protein QXQ48_07925 [Nitrososphaerota archaeon]